MERDIGLNNMMLATVDRFEEEVLVLVTHTEPVREIHPPRELFPDVDEGDVVRVLVEKDEERKEEIEGEVEEIKKGLNDMFLDSKCIIEYDEVRVMSNK
jgi:hypothetical protein